MEKIFVFQDENADYCVIVGTFDVKKAKKALREQEEEWGCDPEPWNRFDKTYIHHGKKDGEDGYYWGSEEPSKYFDDGKFVTERGFVAPLD